MAPPVWRDPRARKPGPAHRPLEIAGEREKMAPPAGRPLPEETRGGPGVRHALSRPGIFQRAGTRTP